MSSLRNRTWPAVTGNRPQTRLTTVDLPEPFGPMRPNTSPCGTLRSRPSTARTPPKCLLSPLSSSIARLPVANPHAFDSGDRRRIDESTRPDIHSEQNEAPEQQVAPVAKEAQPLDQKALDEDDGDQSPEHARETAEDRIGDRKRGERDAELGVLDMGGVVGEDSAAETGNEAADGHRRHLDRRHIDPGALCGDFILTHGAQHGAGARAIHPPQCRHHERDKQPDEHQNVERRPAVLREKSDLSEAFAASRANLRFAPRNLIVEVEEKQPHGLAERKRRDDQHQAFDAQRREADRGGDMPASKHRKHRRDISADSKEASLRKTDLSGQQNTIGRKPQQCVDTDDLGEPKIEIHAVSSIPPSGGGKNAARPEYQKRKQQKHEIEVALSDAAKILKEVLETPDKQAGDDRARNRA